MFFYSRVLPVSGAVPTPGKDISGTTWQQHLRMGEIALFLFDARSVRLLGPKGDVPQLPMQEVCMVFGSRYTARFSAKAHVISKPGSLSVLYDRRGRWLGTFSREGETRRNAGLGLAWLLFQFPLMAAYGTLAILALWAVRAYWFGTEPIRFAQMSSQEFGGLLTGGFFLGTLGRLLFEWLRKRLLIWHAKPALAPMGSPQREKLYQRMAKNTQSGILVPLDVTLVPTEIEWPSPQKGDLWMAVLGKHGFQHFGQFATPETKGSVDFWFDPNHDLIATISALPTKGMWLTVFTRYEDDSSFSVVNRDATGLDPQPRKKVVYLGADATADTVIARALTDRPDGLRRRPVAENLLGDYKKGWRANVEWRRARGTTAEEYKRVAERKARAKAAGESVP
jgi:hypothetical protein